MAGPWELWLATQALRREAAERLGEIVDDPESKAEESRRARWQKQDPALREYDTTLLLQPHEPRLLLARSRRLAELKRQRKAEAGLALHDWLEIHVLHLEAERRILGKKLGSGR